jgi:Tfp pilus assembly protein PilW
MKPTRLRSGRQAGVSLIELMVAALLGAIIVAGLVEVLIANRKAYQLQESHNFQQQNLRFASDTVGWSVRMADFWGGLKAQDVKGLMNNGAGATACNDAWIRSAQSGTNGAGGIFGYDGNGTFPIDGCALVPSADYVQGSDVLVVRYADADPCHVEDGSSALVTAGCLPESADYLVANVGQQAQLFAKGGSIPTTGDTRRYIYPYRLEAYYLQPCSDRGTAATCSASSDGGMPKPTLMRIRLTAAGLIREPLVEGIEQLQFEYGVSSDGSHVSQFKIANDMSATDWSQVIAVRMTLLARSETRDYSIPHAGDFAISAQCTYHVADGGAVTLTTNTHDDCTDFSLAGLSRPDQFSRQIFQQVIQVRNRIRG